MQAEANTIEYDSKTDTVHLNGNSELRRYIGGKLNDTINGSVIVYHNTTGVFTVDGAARNGAKSGSSSRVRATLGANDSGNANANGSGTSKGAKRSTAKEEPNTESTQLTPSTELKGAQQ